MTNKTTKMDALSIINDDKLVENLINAKGNVKELSEALTIAFRELAETETGRKKIETRFRKVYALKDAQIDSGKKAEFSKVIKTYQDRLRYATNRSAFDNDLWKFEYGYACSTKGYEDKKAHIARVEFPEKKVKKEAIKIDSEKVYDYVMRKDSDITVEFLEEMLQKKKQQSLKKVA